MDRLVTPDVKEVDLAFKKAQKCTATFRLSNLMHTMAVAVSLTTTNPSVFSFTQPFSVIPPLSSSSYTLVVSRPSNQPPLSSSKPDVINVRSSMLPTGKARLDDLRRLFSKPGPHVFRDATIPINLVGPHVVEFLISHHSQIPEAYFFFKKAVSGCSGSQLTTLLRPVIVNGNANLVADLIDAAAAAADHVNDDKDSNGLSLSMIDVSKILIASRCEIDHSFDKAAAMNIDVNRSIPVAGRRFLLWRSGSGGLLRR